MNTHPFSLQHILLFFSHLPFFAFILDKNDNIVLWNHNFADLIGVKDNTSKDSIHSHKIFALALLKIKSLQSQKQSEVAGDISFLDNEGQKRFMSISLKNFSLDNESFTVCAMSDETKREQKEAHLLQMAHTDHLTGAFNRRHTVNSLNGEIERFKRGKSFSSLLFIDLDHFKNINDTYGHHAGDEILRAFSELVKKRIRTLDIFGRVGGEEFCLFLANTNAEEAKLVAGNILSIIQNTPISVDNHKISFTCSIGIATIDDSYSNVDQWFQAADKALYHAKQTGRNRFCHVNEMPKNDDQNSENSRRKTR